ncbi:MAG: hypothetical protein IH614_13725 [Desulfuromonadales bacterium]|nr:hypothetical protein [Desulfuromonadales bacterium]
MCLQQPENPRERPMGATVGMHHFSQWEFAQVHLAGLERQAAAEKSCQRKSSCKRTPAAAGGR